MLLPNFVNMFKMVMSMQQCRYVDSCLLFLVAFIHFPFYLKVYQNSPELRRSLDPNLGYGEHHQHNTAMHYAAKHGMKHLLR